MSKINIVHKSSNKKEDKYDKRAQIQKKIKKLEGFEKSREALLDKVNQAKLDYETYFRKANDAFLKDKEALIIKLYERYKQKSFSQNDKFDLVNWIMDEAEELREESFESESIEKIIIEIQNNEVNQLSSEEKKMAQDIFKDMFNGMFEDTGFDMEGDMFESDGFNFENMKEKIEENFHQNQKKEKEIATKEKEQNTVKDFHKLYKSIVKKAHPDLVTNEEEKKKREDFMKKLSAAWDERDYLELLVLEQEITGSENQAIELADSMLKPIIAQLNKRIKENEYEQYKIKNVYVDTAFYYQNFYHHTKKGKENKRKKFKKILTDKHKEVKNNMTELKTVKSTKQLLKRKLEEEDDDFLFDFWE